MTERVPGCNQRTNVQTCRCLRPLSLASLASSPIGGAKGGCAAGFALTYPLRRAGCAAKCTLKLHFPSKNTIFPVKCQSMVNSTLVTPAWAAAMVRVALPGLPRVCT